MLYTKGGAPLNAIGIVAEYNPFHTGHGYQIAASRAALGEERPVVAVMSGNWVQQADCAIADKWTRARLALMGGADLVLELPTVWATSSAEKFAWGAVEILSASGVVDRLSFGSEAGDVDKLSRAAACLDKPDYHSAVSKLAVEGLPFAVCRQRAVEQLAGAEVGAVLARPNNNLGVEYIRALNALHSSITPMTVQRKGADHNGVFGILSPTPERARALMPDYLSATEIRDSLLAGKWDLMEHYLVPGGRKILENNLIGLPQLAQVGRAMLAKVRTMAAEDWGKLPDSGAAEGLPQRLERAGRECRDMDDFFNLARTKRYTHARLDRLVLWAYLGITREDRPEHVPYIRVLGFNGRGRELLKEMKKTAQLPVITKPAHARKLDGAGRKLFELERRCTDLYDLCFEHVPAPGREWTTDVVMVGGEGNV